MPSSTASRFIDMHTCRTVEACQRRPPAGGIRSTSARKLMRGSVMRFCGRLSVWERFEPANIAVIYGLGHAEMGINEHRRQRRPEYLDKRQRHQKDEPSRRGRVGSVQRVRTYCWCSFEFLNPLLRSPLLVKGRVIAAAGQRHRQNRECHYPAHGHTLEGRWRLFHAIGNVGPVVMWSCGEGQPDAPHESHDPRYDHRADVERDGFDVPSARIERSPEPLSRRLKLHVRQTHRLSNPREARSRLNKCQVE